MAMVLHSSAGRRTQAVQGSGLQNRYSPVRIRSSPHRPAQAANAGVVELADARQQA